VFDIVGKRRWFFALSLLLTIPGLIFILLTPISGGQAGLQFSIDYTGGTKWTIRFVDASVTAEQVRTELAKLDQPDASVVQTGRGFFEIKLSKLDLREPAPTATQGPTAAPSGSPAPSASAGGSPGPSAGSTPSASPQASASAGATASPGSIASPGASAAPSAAPGSNTQIPTEGDMGRIAAGLQAALGPIAEQASLTSIGAIVSGDLINQAILLILVGSVAILGWITYRFRDVKFGVTALMALLNDVIIVVGIFAILGTFIDLEIDALFVTAMLTVIGFIVHDTIVVFDRIRENRDRHPRERFAEVVNHSILQTLGRSITTSFTVVLTLLALLLFGGSATHEFVLALLIGIVVGAYSSIFNASPLLVVWQEWEDRRRGRPALGRPATRTTP
jgi:preprotein translocase subunit SecF